MQSVYKIQIVPYSLVEFGLIWKLDKEYLRELTLSKYYWRIHENYCKDWIGVVKIVTCMLLKDCVTSKTGHVFFSQWKGRIHFLLKSFKNRRKISGSAPEETFILELMCSIGIAVYLKGINYVTLEAVASLLILFDFTLIRYIIRFNSSRVQVRTCTCTYVCIIKA